MPGHVASLVGDVLLLLVVVLIGVVDMSGGLLRGGN